MDTFYAVLGADGTPREGLSEARLREELAQGLLTLETLAWRPGLSEWLPLGRVLPESPAPQAPAEIPKAAPEPFRIELALDPVPEVRAEPVEPVQSASTAPATDRASGYHRAPLGRIEEGPDAEASLRLLGVRIAGGLILTNGLLEVFSMARGGVTPFALGAMSVDFLLAGLLLLGGGKHRGWALGRCILGLLLGPVLLSTLGDLPFSWLYVAINTAYCGGLILLLWGETLGVGRLVAGSTFGAGVFGLVFLGLAVGGLGHHELARQVAARSHLSLEAYRPFKAMPTEPLPSQAQARFTDAAEEGSLAAQGAELVCYFETASDFYPDVDRMTRAVFNGWSKGVGGEVGLDEGRSVQHAGLQGLECRGQATVREQALELRVFGFQQGQRIWVVLLAIPRQDAQAEAHIQRILDSIQVDGDQSR
ncbi:MAG TPA: DUF4339 domain-containing protein [Holophagaceae bacterium]|nr:DUF4339 domain-containing protein [Holophagaceae bacterium]